MAAKTPVQIQDIDQGLELATGPLVDLPKVAAPFTTISNRALVTDFSKDLLPRMGIERFHVQQAVDLPTESVSTNDRVFKPVNDIHDQVRFVGTWVQSQGNDGFSVTSGVIGDYVEVVFYGTGINIMMVNLNVADRGFNLFIDGVSVATLNTVNATVLQGRNPPSNVIVPGISGLTLGLHTARFVKTTVGANSNIVGFEILCASGTSPNVLQLPAGSSFLGGKKLYKSAGSVDSYNANFESGTLAARGGRVVVYQKADGSIGKAVRATDASQLDLTAADHTNEELIRVYNFREFGASRADDFSTLTGTTSDRAFTLDDGTTTLLGFNVGIQADGCALQNLNAYLSFTFVGTGMDIDNVFSTSTGLHTISVDGVNIGTGLTGFATGGKRIKIVSGLPYGTHTVKFLVTSAGGANLVPRNFYVYGPKKPTIPTGAVELADYFLMANFAVGTLSGRNSVSTGVLRKDLTREAFYVNGTGGTDWAMAAVDPNTTTGAAEIFSNHLNSYVEYSFYGTGFVLRGRANTNRSANITVTVDGLALTVANFPSLVTSVQGYPSFTAGVLSQVAADYPGAAFSATGLALAKHTVRFTQSAAAGGNNHLQVGALDIITPIHSPRSNTAGMVQNTLEVGSCGISDDRKIADTEKLDIPTWAVAKGIIAGPSTSSTVYVPVSDLQTTIKTTGKPIEVIVQVNCSHSLVGGDMYIALVVDGVQVAEAVEEAHTSGDYHQISISIIIPLSAGVHHLQVYGKTNAATYSFSGINRFLVAKEL